MPWVPNIFVPAAIATERMTVCKTCPEFTTIKLCKQCGCVMPAKVRLSLASCPLQKWSKHEVSTETHFIEDVAWNEMEAEVEKTTNHFNIWKR